MRSKSASPSNPADAWERLKSDPAAILVDVRTEIELALTGALPLVDGHDRQRESWTMTDRGGSLLLIGYSKCKRYRNLHQ